MERTFAGRADLWKRVEHLLPGQLHPWSPPLLSTYTHVSAICSPQLVFAWNNCRPVLFFLSFWKTRLFWWIARCRGVTWRHWRALKSFTSGPSFFTSFFFCCPFISAYISSFLSVLFFASFLFFSIFLLPKKTIFVESARVLLFPCVSSHFLRSVLSLKGVPFLTSCAVSGCKDQFDFFCSRCC